MGPVRGERHAPHIWVETMFSKPLSTNVYGSSKKVSFNHVLVYETKSLAQLVDSDPYMAVASSRRNAGHRGEPPPYTLTRERVYRGCTSLIYELDVYGLPRYMLSTTTVRLRVFDRVFNSFHHLP